MLEHKRTQCRNNTNRKVNYSVNFERVSEEKLWVYHVYKN